MLSHAGVTHEIDGKLYEFEPLTLEAIEYMELWLRARAIEAGRASLPEGIDDEEERRLMAPILEHANKISVFSGDGFDQITTPTGIARLLQRLLRRRHPEVTVSQCMRWIQNPEIMKSLKPKIALLTSTRQSEASNNGEKNSPRPRETKRTTRQP